MGCGGGVGWVGGLGRPLIHCKILVEGPCHRN